MAHPDYWKLKSAFLEYRLRMNEAEAQAQQAEAARAAAFTDAGLDPQKKYKLVDADESITEVESPDGA
jgi:hypothetical protein